MNMKYADQLETWHRMRTGRLLVVAGGLALVATLSGCAATQVALSKRDLDVQTKMSATIFLEPVRADQKTVFVQVRNTSDQADLDLGPDVAQAIAAKGYAIVDDPETAHFILQANVLQVGKSSPSANQAALHGGYGGVLGSGMMGAGSAYALGIGGSREIVGAAIVGSLVESVSGALVKDVYYSITADVQIRERLKSGMIATSSSMHKLSEGTSGVTEVAHQEDSPWKTTQTRIISTANKANLDFAEALPAIRQGLTRSLAGLF